jgi:hypothetical protein
MILTRQNVDGLEIEFSDMLIEDQNNAALSYVDCMIISCQVFSVDSDYLLRSLSSAQADNHGCESRPDYKWNNTLNVLLAYGWRITITRSRFARLPIAMVRVAPLVKHHKSLACHLRLFRNVPLFGMSEPSDSISLWNH